MHMGIWNSFAVATLAIVPASLVDAQVLANFPVPVSVATTKLTVSSKNKVRKTGATMKIRPSSNELWVHLPVEEETVVYQMSQNNALEEIARFSQENAMAGFTEFNEFSPDGQHMLACNPGKPGQQNAGLTLFDLASGDLKSSDIFPQLKNLNGTRRRLLRFGLSLSNEQNQAHINDPDILCGGLVSESSNVYWAWDLLDPDLPIVRYDFGMSSVPVPVGPNGEFKTSPTVTRFSLWDVSNHEEEPTRLSLSRPAGMPDIMKSDSRNGLLFMANGIDAGVIVLQLASNRVTGFWREHNVHQPATYLTGFLAAKRIAKDIQHVTAVAIDEERCAIYISDANSKDIRVFSTSTLEQQGSFTAPTGSISNLEFNNGSNQLLLSYNGEALDIEAIDNPLASLGAESLCHDQEQDRDNSTPVPLNIVAGLKRQPDSKAAAGESMNLVDKVRSFLGDLVSGADESGKRL